MNFLISTIVATWGLTSSHSWCPYADGKRYFQESVYLREIGENGQPKPWNEGGLILLSVSRVYQEATIVNGSTNWVSVRTNTVKARFQDMLFIDGEWTR